ncbi:MAG: class I SAM-dependent methyltransferase [Desulfobacterales bacterium]|nr:class I SAM-dependent methyltransferase [Desulfobacterales bacterium]
MHGWQKLWQNQNTGHYLQKDETMLLGSEQIFNPNYSTIEKIYIAMFGMPIIGLRIRARNIFSLIPKNKKYRHILDAGSGPGVFSFELGRRFPDAKVLGIDLQEEAVEQCIQIADKVKAENVTFRKASVEQIPEQNYFDLIVCVDILEHIHDDLTALKRLCNAASPGGTLVLHVPALYRRYPAWKKSLNFDVESHVRIGYELHEIIQKVRDTGFLVCESGFTYGFWETLANNISYMITHARMENKMLYALVFPVLNMISLLGIRARPKTLGAGIFVVAEKGQ